MGIFPWLILLISFHYPNRNEFLHEFVLNFDILYSAVSLKWKNFDFGTAFKISLEPHLIKT